MTTTSEPVEGVRCILLPVRGGYLLLPMVAMIEVMGYEDPQRPAQSPTWYLGLLPWRGLRVPVVRLAHSGEALADPLARERPRRIAICRGINSEGPVPFIGLAIQASPRLVEASEGNIEPWIAPDPAPDFVLQTVRVAGDDAWIPDMEFLAASIAPLI